MVATHKRLRFKDCFQKKKKPTVQRLFMVAIHFTSNSCWTKFDQKYIFSLYNVIISALLGGKKILLFFPW